jgi:hypothetical protein
MKLLSNLLLLYFLYCGPNYSLSCCFLPMPVQQRIWHFILKEAGGLSNERFTEYIYMRRYRQQILFMSFQPLSSWTTGPYFLPKTGYCHLLTHCSRVLVDKLTGSQLVKKCTPFYGTSRFTLAFTTAQHLFSILSQITNTGGLKCWSCNIFGIYLEEQQLKKRSLIEN